MTQIKLNNLSGVLKIETDKPDVDTGSQLANRFIEPGAKITSMRLKTSYVAEQLKEVVIKEPKIRLKSETYSATYSSKKGFTLKQLLKRIELFEKKSRVETKWFDGSDAHHVFLEGVHKKKGNTYVLGWGS